MRLERVVLEVFGGCNYECPMCPQTTGRESSFLRKMPLKLFESILDQITPKYGHPVINLEGSGEPTLARDLPKYIRACTSRGLPTYIYSNGSKMSGQFMRDCIDAGLTFIRFSCIGANRQQYKKWMGKDNFDLLRRNILETTRYIADSGSACKVASYHLITEEDEAAQIQEYQDNIVVGLGTIGYIWRMHNWSGNTETSDRRVTKRRSCGRPFANELTVRAGGLNGKLGAVTPCCQTMGPPNESKSVLGHFEDQTFEQIWDGQLYNELRAKHEAGDFDSIDYCKGCDFLYDDPEVLVWTNDETFSIHQMLGTQLDLQKFIVKS